MFLVLSFKSIIPHQPYTVWLCCMPKPGIHVQRTYTVWLRCMLKLGNHVQRTYTVWPYRMQKSRIILLCTYTVWPHCMPDRGKSNPAHIQFYFNGKRPLFLLIACNTAYFIDAGSNVIVYSISCGSLIAVVSAITSSGLSGVVTGISNTELPSVFTGSYLCPSTII